LAHFRFIFDFRENDKNRFSFQPYFQLSRDSAVKSLLSTLPVPKYSIVIFVMNKFFFFHVTNLVHVKKDLFGMCTVCTSTNRFVLCLSMEFCNTGSIGVELNFSILDFLHGSLKQSQYSHQHKKELSELPIILNLCYSLQ
jgi:hypothetical protein